MFSKVIKLFSQAIEVQFDPSKQRALKHSIVSVHALPPDQSLMKEKNKNGTVVRQFANFAIRFQMERHFQPYFMRTYLSSGVVVITSWISFIVDPDVVPGRMALLVTLLLVLVNMR
jgi:hypothetical protein